MTDQGTAPQDLLAGAEPPEPTGEETPDSAAFVPVTTERAPPAVGSVDPASPGSATPVLATDEVLLIERVEVGPAEPAVPVQFGRAVLGVPRQASEPYVLPPEGNLAFILGNKHVWRRFIISVIVLASAILALAVALRIADVHVDGLATVGVTGAATAVSVTAYIGRRWATRRASPSDTASGDRPSS